MRSAFSPLLAILADITTNDAAKYVGKTVGVKGTAVEVFLSKGGNAYLNFFAAVPKHTFSA